MIHRKIIRNIVNGSKNTLESLGLNANIKMVYTILDEDGLYYKFDPMTGKPVEKDINLLNLSHLKTVFVEDQIHDWNIVGDSFKFHPHSSGLGESVDILVEYEL